MGFRGSKVRKISDSAFMDEGLAAESFLQVERSPERKLSRSLNPEPLNH